MPVITVDQEGQVVSRFTLAELFPHPFGLPNLLRAREEAKKVEDLKIDK